MNDLQKMGGAAALIEAAAYVVGFTLLLALLVPAGHADGTGDPARSVAFLADNQATMYIWNLIIYVLAGVVLVVLVLALHERLKVGSPALVQVATAFGLIWACLVIASGMIANIGLETVVDLHGRDQTQAATVWVALNAVQEGLGGGVEIVGGLWVLLLSWAALRTGALARTMNYLGLLIGVAGILTVVPALEMLAAVFGLGFILWYTWVGIVMLRGNVSATSRSEVSVETAAALR